MRVGNKYVWLGLGVSLSLAAHGEASLLTLKLSRSLSQPMTEIRFVDRERDQSELMSRYLLFGEKIRVDYGRDDQGFILFDRAKNTIWHVSPTDRRLTGFVPREVRDALPSDWKISRESMPSEGGALVQIRLNDTLCVEYKAMPMLKNESVLIADYRRALAARQARAWLATPESMRNPCSLVLDTQLAGVEFTQGFPLAARYWDGRTRMFQGHEQLPPRPELFELPKGYLRSMVGRDGHEKEMSRQPLASHSR